MSTPQDRPPPVSVVYGLHAALAVAEHRPQAIVRVFHDVERRKAVAPLLKAAAAARKPYREVEPDELQKIAETVHHEGVVVVTTPLPLLPLSELIGRLGPSSVLLALDEVGNPHNLGAILRSAAYFGAAGVIFPATPKQATLSAAAVRIAQGGAEVVPACGVPDLAEALRELAAKGVVPVGADTRGGHSLFTAKLPRAACYVFGNEGEGLNAATRSACAQRVSIPGSGAVESLNVSVAAGILLAYAAAAALPRPARGRRQA